MKTRNLILIIIALVALNVAQGLYIHELRAARRAVTAAENQLVQQCVAWQTIPKR